MIIPGFVFFAAVACDRGLDVPEASRSAALVAVFVALVGFAAWKGAAFWWRSEDSGAWDQIKALAELVPLDDLVFAAGRPEWMTPLYVAFDRRIVPLDLDQDLGWELLARGVAEQIRRGKSAYLLYDKALFFSSQPREVGRVNIFRRFLENTAQPVPSRFTDVHVTVVLAAITDSLEPPKLHHCALGGSKVWGVAESGFYNETPGFYQRMRWTSVTVKSSFK